MKSVFVKIQSQFLFIGLLLVAVVNTSAAIAINEGESMMGIVVQNTPRDTTVNCQNYDPFPDQLLVSDECEGDLLISVVEQSTRGIEVNECSFYSYVVNRIYTLSNSCDETLTLTQVITVIDTTPPVFDAPDDVTVRCEDKNKLDITGEIGQLLDECGGPTIKTFEDEELGTACSQSVLRTWTLTDNCGNSAQRTQVITLSDTTPPIFLIEPLDISISCSQDESPYSYFNNWVENFGNSIFTDNCSGVLQIFAASPGSYDVTDSSSFPGEHPGALADPECGAISGSIQSESVDFVLVDHCGNVTVKTSTFYFIDDVPPVIQDCSDDVTLNISAAICDTIIKFVIPTATEECVLEDFNIDIVFEQIITSAAQNVDSIIVNSVQVELGPYQPEIKFETQNFLNVSLSNIDADHADEVFVIIDEDGNEIGTTPNTEEECGIVDFQLGPFSDTLMKAWTQDKIIKFTFAPKINELNPRNSINDICTVSRIKVSQSYSFSREIEDVKILFGINDSNPFEITGIEVNAKFTPGTHDVFFIAEDCSGNRDTCVKKITVFDNIGPSIVCANNMILESKGVTCAFPVIVSEILTINEVCNEDASIKIKCTGALIDSIEGTYKELKNQKFEFPLGISQVSIVANDFSGNSDECSLQINVVDSDAPIAICEQMTVPVVAVTLDLMAVDPNLVAGNSTDNCGISNISIINNSFSCSDLGTTVGRNVVVTDNAGNSSSCVGNFFLEEIDIPISVTASLCPNDILRFIVNIEHRSSYTYFWTGPNGFSSVEADPFIPNAQSGQNGTYNLVMSNVNNGCLSTGSVEVDIDAIKNPTISSDTLGCEGVPFIVHSTAIINAYQYLWYDEIDGQHVLIDTSSAATNGLELSPGFHKLSVAIDDGQCFSVNSNTISILIRKKPEGATCTGLVEGCMNDPLVLCSENTNSESSLSWFGPNGFSSTEVNPTVTMSFDSSDQGIYKLLVFKDGCYSDTLTTAVSPNQKPPKPDILGNLAFCTGDTLFLASSVVKSDYIYSWNTPAGIFRTNEPILRIPEVSAQYTGKWSLSIEQGPCNSESSNEVSIYIEPNLLFSSTPIPTQCIGTTVQLESSDIQGSTYLWTGPQGFTSDIPDPTIDAIAGLYSVTMTSPSGCIYTDESLLETVEVPSIFGVDISQEGDCIAPQSTLLILPQLNSFLNVEYDWKGPNFSTDEPVINISNFNVNNNGTYTLQVNNGDCTSEIFEFNIDYTVQPVQAIIDTEPVACIGDSIFIISNQYTIGTQYFWNTPNGIVETSTNKLSIGDVDPTMEGQYSLTVVRDECESITSDELSIKVNENTLVPVIFNQGGKCVESNINLFTNLNAAIPQEWNLPNGQTIFTDTIKIINASIQDTGSYSVRSYFNSCPSDWSEIYNLDISDPRIGVAIADNFLFSCNNEDAFLEFCVNDESNLEGKRYLWYTKGELIGETFDPCFPVMDFSKFSVGVNQVELKLEHNDCVLEFDDIIFVEIEDVNNLNIEAGEDQLYCLNQEIFVNADAPISEKLFSYWEFDQNIEISDTKSPSATVVIMEDISAVNLVWTIEHVTCGVIFRDTIKLTQKTKPEAVNDTFYFDDSELVFDPLENDVFLQGSEYELLDIEDPRWGKINTSGSVISYKTDPQFVGGPITFQYTVCDTECPELCGTGEVIVYYNLDSCKGNNVLTPNNDGSNDIFVIPCLEEQGLPENELIIINELGNTVYQKSPYDNSWDGTFNGETLPEGTYYYLFKKDPKSSINQGFIAIER